MKQLHVDFIETKHLQWVWLAALLACISLAGLAVWQWRQSATKLRELETQITVNRAQLALLNAPKAVVIDPKQASADQASKLLQLDLNKAFASAENLKEFGVRLRNFNLDGMAGTLRLEFELDSLPRASSVTAVLNAGYDTPPWQLESVTGATLTAQPSLVSTQTLRGLWFAQLAKL